jgi:hypothetical protein
MRLSAFLGVLATLTFAVQAGEVGKDGKDCKTPTHKPTHTPNCKKSVRSCHEVIIENHLQPFCSSYLHVKPVTKTVHRPGVRFLKPSLCALLIGWQCTKTIHSGQSTITDLPTTVPGPVSSSESQLEAFAPSADDCAASTVVTTGTVTSQSFFDA